MKRAYQIDERKAIDRFRSYLNTNPGNIQLVLPLADLAQRRLLDSTLMLQFSEFGRRITENGSQGTDHGAGAMMMAIGGGVRGGLYGTAPNLNPTAGNPTLENSGGDVTYETDFRSVYARVLDAWMGTDSVSILGGNFRRLMGEAWQ